MIFGWTAWPILFDERLQKPCILRLVLPRQHGELRQYPVPHRVEPAAVISLSSIFALATFRFHDGSGARFHIVGFHFPRMLSRKDASFFTLSKSPHLSGSRKENQ